MRVNNETNFGERSTISPVWTTSFRMAEQDLQAALLAQQVSLPVRQATGDIDTGEHARTTLLQPPPSQQTRIEKAQVKSRKTLNDGDDDTLNGDVAAEGKSYS
jgi:hypothetical protein